MSDTRGQGQPLEGLRDFLLLICYSIVTLKRTQAIAFPAEREYRC